jgi:alpha-L-fucosidase
MKNFFVFILFGIFISLVSCKKEEDCVGPIYDSIHETAQEYKLRMKWFTDAKFGVMVHWGPVTLTGKDMSWSRYGFRKDQGKMPEWDPEKMTKAEVYDTLYKAFNPVNFDADRWMEIVSGAGAKYFVITTKHHDGFCMWDTKYSDYKITSKESPYGQDVCSQIAVAARKNDIRLGWYYSPTDWYDPDFFTPTHSKYIEKMHGHISELMRNYGVIDLWWFDSGSRGYFWNSSSLIDSIKAVLPNSIFNNRSVYEKGDYYTPEGFIEKFNNKRPWETVISISRYWSYHPDSELISADECIKMLCLCAGRGGNLLLNITPGPDGSIENRQKEILAQIGCFLNENGDKIYKTEAGPYVFQSDNFAATFSGKTLNIWVLDKSVNELIIPNISGNTLTNHSFKNLSGAEFSEGTGGFVFNFSEVLEIPGIISLEFSDEILNKTVNTAY